MTYYLNRNLCEVFEEMRTMHKTRNYSYLLGLIEEAQTMGNRMEAGLDDKSVTIRRLKKELKGDDEKV